MWITLRKTLNIGSKNKSTIKDKKTHRILTFYPLIY